MGDFDNNDDDLYFSPNFTFVFWNFEDYPITADYVSIRRNIESALYRIGLCNVCYIEVYADKQRQEKSALSEAKFIYTPPEDAPFVMALDILSVVRQLYDNTANLVVIAKQSPKSELTRVLHCLKSRNIPVVVVEPPDDTTQDSVFHSVDALVDCTHLLGGEKLISIRPQSSAYDLDDDAFRWRKCTF